MKKTFSHLVGGLCALTAAGVITACSGGKTLTIDGTLTAELRSMLEPGDTLACLVTLEGDTLAQQRIADDGSFSLTYTVDETQLCLLELGPQINGIIVAEPGKLSVSLEEAQFIATGTPQNDALTEYFTTATELENSTLQRIYSLPQPSDSDSTLTTKQTNFSAIMNEYLASLQRLSDSIYNANFDNEVGLFMALSQMQSMNTSAEVRERFGDNEHVMSSPWVKEILDDMDNASADFGPDIDEADIIDSIGDDTPDDPDQF